MKIYHYDCRQCDVTCTEADQDHGTVIEEHSITSSDLHEIFTFVTNSFTNGDISWQVFYRATQSINELRKEDD